MSQNNKFDDLIKNKALNFDAEVPADMWDRIQLPKKKKRRIGFWWFLIPTVAAVGASVLLMYNFSHGNLKSVTKEFEEKNLQSTRNQIEKENKSINQIGQKIANTSKTETEINTYSLKDNTNSQKSSLNIVTNEQSEVTPNQNYSSDFNRLSKNSRSGVFKKKQQPAEDNLFYTSIPDLKDNKTPVKDRDVVSVEEKLSAGTDLQEKSETDSAIHNLRNLPENNTEPGTNISGTKDIQNEKNDDSEEPVVRIESKKKQNKSWYIETNFSIYNTLMSRDNGLLKINREFNNPLFRSKFVSEKVETNIHSGFSVGAVVKKEFGRFKIGTGLNYSHLYEKINIGGRDSTILTSIVNRLNSSGTGLYQDTVYQVVTGSRNISAENASNIYSVPVFAEYALISKGKWHFSLNGGLYFNYMVYKNSLTGEVHSIFPGGTRLLNNAKGIGLDGHLGFRVNYNLMQRLGLYIEPNLRMNLVQMKDGVFINTKSLDRIGIMFGTNIRLNKK